MSSRLISEYMSNEKTRQFYYYQFQKVFQVIPFIIHSFTHTHTHTMFHYMHY